MLVETCGIGVGFETIVKKKNNGQKNKLYQLFSNILKQLLILLLNKHFVLFFLDNFNEFDLIRYELWIPNISLDI